MIDADLSGYFDTIPHAELMKSVARRISDGRMLRLIKMWLTAPAEEADKRGRKRRTTPNKDQGRGVPQGAPISPLLANLYMRRFILGWRLLGHQRRLKAHIVNDADDFVICCRGTAKEAMRVMRFIMQALKWKGRVEGFQSPLSYIVICREISPSRVDLLTTTVVWPIGVVT